jgi:hypothetical protein
LDFANSEIERLRSKLIIDDEDMPTLSSELLGNSNYKMSLDNNMSGSNHA